MTFLPLGPCSLSIGALALDVNEPSISQVLSPQSASKLTANGNGGLEEASLVYVCAPTIIHTIA